MTFSNGPQTEDEAARAARHRGLVRMRDDAWIEQRCRFEGVLVQKVGAHELALYLREGTVHRVNDFHGVGTRLEGREQPAVAALEGLEQLRQLLGGGIGIEREDPIDDVRYSLRVRRGEIAGLGTRLEVPHHHSGRVRTETQGLTFH